MRSLVRTSTDSLGIDGDGGPQSGQPRADDQDVGEVMGNLFRVKRHQIPMRFMIHGLRAPPSLGPRALPFSVRVELFQKFGRRGTAVRPDRVGRRVDRLRNCPCGAAVSVAAQAQAAQRVIQIGLGGRTFFARPA